MKTLVNSSVELLHILKAQGYNSVMHLPDDAFGERQWGEDGEAYYILRPSTVEVTEDFSEVNGDFYSPILSDDVIDMAKNDTPPLTFLIEIDKQIYKDQ